MKPHEKVKALTGKEMILFRPPYGDYNDNLIRVCREINYYPIQWDVDSLDWKDYDADTIVRPGDGTQTFGKWFYYFMPQWSKTYGGGIGHDD